MSGQQVGYLREQLTAAVAAVDATTRPAADTHLDDLFTRYSLVRRFLPALLSTLKLQAAPGGTDVLQAWEALRTLEGHRTVRAEEVPLTLATGPWAPSVLGPDGLLNRPAYTFLVLERLREALRRRDVYAPASQRWSDPRARLLDGKAWAAVRDGVAVSLGRDLDPHRELAVLAADLDAAYRAVAGRLEHNDAVRIEAIDGHDRPVLTALDRLEEPPRLLALRAAVDALLPRLDLPTYSWKSPAGPGSSPNSPTSPKAPPAPRTWGSASAPSWSPRHATSASNRSCRPATRR